MEHLTNITSLSDLVQKYRILAQANHPDHGGDEKILKAINNEYDELYPIWRAHQNRMDHTDIRETGQESRRRFYTAWGWEGKNYNRNLRCKDIAKIVRAHIKAYYPTYKISVRSEHNYIRVALLEAPQDILVHEKLSDFDRKYMEVQVYRPPSDRLTELGNAVLMDIYELLQSYNYDDSDAMTDYFDTNFYCSLDVGPGFKVVERTARVNGPNPTRAAVIPAPTVSTVENHIPHAYTITEETDTRDDSPCWVVRFEERLPKEEFRRIRDLLGKQKGYYSGFKRGFLFRYDPAETMLRLSQKEEN